jgi:hypothetical protein
MSAKGALLNSHGREAVVRALLREAEVRRTDIEPWRLNKTDVAPSALESPWLQRSTA